ncbi:hypothetical protein L9G74_14055 [Shewanella sp. C32]|uniref:DUF304 domain-containing protein n=1 Tax=Shewanella electrica TaxID=515560 RepID=A0ABT2FQT2_9GAMM|nr:hypothetical protein [Shewanella electrica]MCH1926062.1 hypothetical protein [Shewanella electrica]MCS4557569.1 hypothetical protein [Shewanella electrica]
MQLKSTLNEHQLVQSLGDILFRPGRNPKDLIKANFKQTAIISSIMAVVWLLLAGVIVSFIGDWRTWYVSVALVIALVLWLFLSKMLWNTLQMLNSTQWEIIGRKGILSQRRDKSGKVLNQTLIRFSQAMHYRQMGKTLEVRLGKQRLLYRDGPKGTYAAMTYQAALEAVLNYRPSHSSKGGSRPKKRRK